MLVAAAVCVLAAITTFIALQHARANGSRRLPWVTVAAVVSGIGIWATHFIAMLAYHPVTEITFGLTATLLSVLAASSFSGIGWWIALGEGRWSASLGGAVAGAGVAVMHYIGMSALQFVGHIIWDEYAVLLSLIIGIALSAAAAAEHRRRSGLIPWRPALLFTLGICSLHFVGMSAVMLHTDVAAKISNDTLEREALIVAVVALALLICIGCFAAILFDRLNDFRNNLIAQFGKNLVIQNALEASETLNRGVIEASPDGISLIDLDGSVDFVNHATISEYGIQDPGTLVGRPWGSRFPSAVRVRTDAALCRARSGEVTRLLLQLGEGDERWWDVMVAPVCNSSGTPIKIVTISRDVTTHKTAEELANWKANHDALTSLPNRRSFQVHLQAAILRAMENGSSAGLLLLDLDHFKNVNDTMGHAAGDYLLQTSAKRLISSVRTEDFIARLGGDEFAVILENVEGPEELLTSGASILDRLTAPVSFEGRVINGGASIGGAIYPRDGASAHELVKSADTALYALKGAGRGGTRMFHNHMRAEAQRTASQLSLARDALDENSVVPHYQPKVHLNSGVVAGFEALLRWRHLTRGMQEPGTVAEAFNDYGLASKISKLMHEKVFQDICSWRHRGLEVGHVSLNAAPAEFLRDDYASKLLSRLSSYQLPPSLIEVEITEHVFSERGSKYVARALSQLKEAGVRISLDDFGTGYSSLSHLRDFPVDVVKIDRSFVAQMIADQEVAAIVRAVIDLAQSLSIKVVAEGVETANQRDFLTVMGCHFGQGWLFGKAAPPDEICGMVRRAA